MAIDLSKFSTASRSVINGLSSLKASEPADSGRLLLALLAVDPRLTARLGLDAEVCRRAVQDSPVREQALDGFSTNVHRAVQLAEIEAWRDNGGLINPAHLLLGLLSDKSSRATLVLRDLGLNHERMRAVLHRPANLEAADSQAGDASAWLVDLVELARQDKLDPVIGRDAELLRLVQILNRRRKNNPVLIGPAGVGKTAVVEGLALWAAQPKNETRLNITSIYALDLAALVAGTKYRGEFEARLKQVLDLVTGRPDCVLFIDEIHMLMGAGGAESALDASNILKPALSRGEIRCIGSTTPSEYLHYIEKDAAFARRFQAVAVSEPSAETVLQMLQGLKSLYENHHDLQVSDEILTEIVHYADEFVSDRYFPDKAIDLLDEAMAQAGLHMANGNGHHLDKAHLATVLEQWTGLPQDLFIEGYGSRLKLLEHVFQERLFGQDVGMQRLLNLLQQWFLLQKSGPRALLLQGPPGCGKTNAVELLMKTLFDGNNVRELDLAAYRELHGLSGLIGTHAGYVGYGDKPLLSRLLQESANGILIVRGFSKAHAVVQDLLAQLVAAGTITDGVGSVIQAGNALFIFIEETHGVATDFTPGRLCIPVVAFRALQEESLGRIARFMLHKLAQSMAAYGLSFNYTPAVEVYLTGLVTAAAIFETIESMSDKQSLDILQVGAAQAGLCVIWDVVDGKLVFVRK